MVIVFARSLSFSSLSVIDIALLTLIDCCFVVPSLSTLPQSLTQIRLLSRVEFGICGYSYIAAYNSTSHRFEKRAAFLSNTSPRPPHWLPRSSPGLRPTIRFADRQYCTPLIYPRSGRHPRRRSTTRLCRRSAPSLLVAIYRGHRRRARPWRRSHTNRCNGRAVMPRSSCQPCRLLLH